MCIKVVDCKVQQKPVSASAQSHEAEAEFQDSAPRYALPGQFQAPLGGLNFVH
jgi:hypothetical protein